MMSELCRDCGEDTSFGSGKFVNRIPADDGWVCAECMLFDCDECGANTLEVYTCEIGGDFLCEVCSETCENCSSSFNKNLFALSSNNLCKKCERR